MYDKGESSPQDYVQAHKWFNLAAVASSTDRVADMRGLVAAPAANMRDIVAARMTPAQIAEAQQRAREWKQQ
jgi:uncharacterized protein